MADFKDHAQTLFLDALEISDKDERAGFLDEQCGADRELRKEVEELLEHAPQLGNFLDPGAGCVFNLPVSERSGDVIGPYRLLEQIGEGGFGVVFLAEQEQPVRRKVALKIVKPGMDTRQVVSRFEAERQALAMMDHPSIAKVFDAGATSNGRPFFAMELVQGVPITEYCDECRLPTRERLELFVLVCQAVQHAHQKGVIHRDLKPTNVLVALQDGRPLPKIIDFGVAKAVNERLTEMTLASGFLQMIGTPMYMSPEQAALSPLGVDTRSDVYSLGVLLYELLTGMTPFDKSRLHAAGYDELRLIIREEEPLRPSAHLSTIAADMATTVAEGRRTDSRRLIQTVRGELDWIVMRCLEKDRNRRYGSASALADDVQRYLADEPVVACPPSAAYRVQKFVRRNRMPVLAASLVVVALVVGIIGATWGLLRAVEERDQKNVALKNAVDNRRKATQAVDDFLTSVSESTLAEDPALGSLRHELLKSALDYYQEFVQQDPTDPALQAELVAAYMRIAYLVYTLDPEQDWLTPAGHAFDLMENLLQKSPALSELQSLSRGLDRPSGASAYMRNPQEILRTFIKGRALWQQLVDEHPNVIGFQIDLATMISVVAGAHANNGEPVLALKAKRECCSLLRNIVKENPGYDAAPADLAIALANLARAEAMVGNARAAEQAALESVNLAQELKNSHQGEQAFREILAWVQWAPAEVHEHFGRFDAAAIWYRKRADHFAVLASEFPTVPRYQHELLNTLLALGEVLWAADRVEEAADVWQEAKAIVPMDSHGLALRAWLLATCPLSAVRDADEALLIAEKLVELKPTIGDYWLARGAAKFAVNNWKGAANDIQRGIALPHEPLSSAHLIQPMVQWRSGEYDEARKSYHDAMQWLGDRWLRYAEVRRLSAEAAALFDEPMTPTAFDANSATDEVQFPMSADIDQSSPISH